MLSHSGARQAVAVLAGGLFACAYAQTPPDPAAPNAQHAPPSCESGTFPASDAISIPQGAKIPAAGVVVRVQVEFEDTSAAPAVKTLFNSGDPVLADAVIASAKRARFNCVRVGKGPVRYFREVQFVGGDTPKVVAGSYRPLQTKWQTCFVSADGKPAVSGALFNGASTARSPDFEGLIIVKLRFEGPNVAPEASVLFRRGHSRFETATLDYLADYRWTCMKPGDPAVEAVQVFEYLDRSVASASVGTFRQLLAAVDKITEQKVRFDFTTMACPFTITLNYLQPFMLNDVVQIGGENINRREFVHWLKQVKFKPELNPDNKLVGRDFEVSVPCLVLDLT